MRIDVHFSSDIPRKFRNAHQERINGWLHAVGRGGTPWFNFALLPTVSAVAPSDPEAAVSLVTLHATRTKLYEAGEIGSVGERLDISLTPASKPLVEAWMKAAA